MKELEGFPVLHLKNCISSPPLPPKAALFCKVFTANGSSPISLIKFLIMVLLSDKSAL